MLLINSEWSVINHFVQSSHMQDLFPFLITKKKKDPSFLWLKEYERKKRKTGGEDEWWVKGQIECMYFNLAVVLYNFFLPKDC